MRKRLYWFKRLLIISGLQFACKVIMAVTKVFALLYQRHHIKFFQKCGIALARFTDKLIKKSTKYLDEWEAELF